MRSVVKWLCHSEEMKVHVRDNVSQVSQDPEDSLGIRFIRTIRFIRIIHFILIILTILITRDMEGTVINNY